KFFFEGQEEIGSPQLGEFIPLHRDKLACDLILSADGGQWSETEPALEMGLRGICGLQIDVVGPDHDVHSGTYGGAIQNPIHALAHLLASMRNPEGKILVEGFYDDVVELSVEERQALAQIPYDEEEYKKELGVNALFGEPGYTTRERTWVRPTLEVNGIWGGFQGEGTKTVLPSEAHAKITCRLVPQQDPQRILDCIADHIARHTLPGVRVTLQRSAGGTRPYRVPAKHPGNQAAANVLRELYGREPYRIYMGGTIPVTPLFLEHLGAYTVVFAFGLHDERTHSPNEFYRLSSFRRAQKAYAMLFSELAQRL
ncbi:MAG: M20/M25/M40 family metallo-hydrolase, partial [Chloroflexi bacterium]|nr:M20/M25/M40 family metallo-hydrolase [Chloroflexota bacterium]